MPAVDFVTMNNKAHNEIRDWRLETRKLGSLGAKVRGSRGAVEKRHGSLGAEEHGKFCEVRVLQRL